MKTLDMVWKPLMPMGLEAARPDSGPARRNVPDDLRWQALQRVLSSPTFARTARLASFLRYVCVASIEGRAASLSEQHIGSQVFDRPEHYNPAEDTIVRTTARLLRLRLASYYEAEGRADPMRIVIPRGGYAPSFEPAGPTLLDAEVRETEADVPAGAEAVSPSLAVDAPEPAGLVPPSPLAPAVEATPQAGALAQSVWPGLKRSLTARPRRLAFSAALTFAMVSSLYALAPDAAPRDATSAFWGSLFSAERDTVLVPADSALVAYQQTAHREIALDDYVAQRLGNDQDSGGAEDGLQFRARRHTAVTSVALAAEFGKLAQRAPKRFHVRFARDLHLADLKQSNAILIGVRQANPWVELFRSRLNFHIDWDSASGKFWVRNDRPLPGEQALYEFSAADPDKRAYASIAYLRSLSGEAHVLMVGGTTAAGTEAAAEFLLDPLRLAPVLARAGLPDGSVGEFEVLLQSVLRANGSTDIQVLGVRAQAS